MSLVETMCSITVMVVAVTGASAYSYKASLDNRKEYLLDSAGTWIEVYSYASDSSDKPDRYTRLYAASGDLAVEEGTLDPRVTLNVRTVCSNVTQCTFKANGRSAQMLLTLQNADQTIEVPAVAFMHNK